MNNKVDCLTPKLGKEYKLLSNIYSPALRENDKGLYATMIGGEMNLSAQDCCVERNYWLGSDGVLYNAGVLGMDSWEYANLKSHVRMGWYGARVNVHLLGLFHKATVTCKPCWATSPT